MLCCARTHVDAGVAQRMRDLAGRGVDWPQLRALAERHGVTPLLFNALSGVCGDAVPSGVLAELRERAEHIAGRNEFNLNVLLRILKLFGEAGIPVVPFKGVAAALADYGSLRLRTCGDVDLLVHRADFLKAKDLLLHNGYHHMYFGHHEVSTVQAALHDGKLSVDLHYGITPHFHIPQMDQIKAGSRFGPDARNRLVAESTYWFFYLDCDPLWDRLAFLTVADVNIPAFAPEDSLVVACIQGIKENWRRLTRVCDVAQIVRSHPGLDWDRVLRQVAALGCERKFLLSLHLAHRLLDTPLPAEVSRRIAARPVLERLAVETRRRFFTVQDALESDLFRHSSSLLTMDRARDRVRYLGYALRRLKVPGQRALSLRRYLKLLRNFAAQL